MTGNPSTPLSFSRRRLLAAGVGVGGLALLGAGGAAWAVMGRQAPGPGRAALSAQEAAFVDALVDAMFPPGNALGVAGKDVDVTGQLDAWAADMAPSERRIVASLLHLFDLWPRLSLSSTARFSALDREDRVRVLQAFDESAVETRRALGQLTRALVSLPFFEDPRTLAGMGMEWGCAVAS